jgi:hypothetical protein
MNVKLIDTLHELYPEALLMQEDMDFNLYFKKRNISLVHKDVQIHFSEASIYISKADDEVDILIFHHEISDVLFCEKSFRIVLKNIPSIIILEIPEWRQVGDVA